MKDISPYISFLLDDVPCEVVLQEEKYVITLLTKRSAYEPFNDLLELIMDHKIREIIKRIKENFPNEDFKYDVTYRIVNK